jgi:hypothetical protein
LEGNANPKCNFECRTFLMFLRRPGLDASRYIHAFRGVAETLLHEIAIRRSLLWGFGCGDEAPDGILRRCGAERAVQPIDAVTAHADFGFFHALSKPHARGVRDK